MSAAVTPWFPMDIRPLRTGPYQLRYSASAKRLTERYAVWVAGDMWLCSGSTVNEAERNGCRVGRSNDCYSGVVTGWRGLAEKPE
jgi:hypothetical protein